jgi:hypothetical protein
MRFPSLTTRRMTGLVVTVVCAAALTSVATLAATAYAAAPATTARAAVSATAIPAISVNSVTLVADGAAIQVEFTATCGAGDDGNVGTNTTQAVGTYIAQDSTRTGFTCTGKPQHMSAVGAANVNGVPFRPGIAISQVGLTDCPGANCTGASINKVLSITR